MRSMRLPLRAKLLGAFGLVLLLMVGLGALGVKNITSVESGVEELHDEALASALASGNLQEAAQELRKDQYRFMAGNTAKRKEIAEVDITADLRKARGAIDASAELAQSDEQRRTVAAIDKLWEQYVSETDALVANGQAGRTTANLTMLADAADTFNPLIEQVVALEERNQAYAEAVFEDAQATSRDATRTTIAVVLVAIVFSVGVALLLSRSVSRGVRQVLDRLDSLSNRDSAELKDGLEHLAQGDLTREVVAVTEPIGSWSNDEIGDVAQAVNATREHTAASVEAYTAARIALADMIGEVGATAGTVSAASQQMASTSEEAGRAVGEIANAVTEVASGAQRQVQSVEDAKRMTEEVAEATRESASNAKQTVEAARETQEMAEAGMQAAAAATDAMGAVRDASQQAADAIGELGAKSEQIGGIVDPTQLAQLILRQITGNLGFVAEKQSQPIGRLRHLAIDNSANVGLGAIPARIPHQNHLHTGFPLFQHIRANSGRVLLHPFERPGVGFGGVFASLRAKGHAVVHIEGTQK